MRRGRLAPVNPCPTPGRKWGNPYACRSFLPEKRVLSLECTELKNGERITFPSLRPSARLSSSQGIPSGTY